VSCVLRTTPCASRRPASGAPPCAIAGDVPDYRSPLFLGEAPSSRRPVQLTPSSAPRPRLLRAAAADLVRRLSRARRRCSAVSPYRQQPWPPRRSSPCSSDRPPGVPKTPVSSRYCSLLARRPGASNRSASAAHAARASAEATWPGACRPSRLPSACLTTQQSLGGSSKPW
jgi:hypothetical protein